VTSRQRPTKDLLVYLRTLAAEPQPEQFLELRWPTPDGWMQRRFFDAHATQGAAHRIIGLAARGDVYVGVALRDRATDGGRDAISGSHLLFVECDDPHTRRRLASLALPPTLEVASGTPEHLHLYWRLHRRATNAQVESANRRLALLLGGDPACADIARILRPPDTLNHKHDPPRAVRLLSHRPGARYTLAELTSGLPADARLTGAAPGRSTPCRVGRSPLDHALLAIPPAEYVRVLANVSPNRAGKVLCPFHDDTDPSLQLYPDGTFHCFGSRCRRGGTIYDFAAASWGLGTRGQDFLELRRRLVLTFGVTLRLDWGS
jgi:hypothetical protein